MQYSVAFASEVDSWRWAKRAEELGYHAAWFYDTQLLNPDVFICMALAAHETSRIRLGTGVLVPSNRIEPVTANAFASLNRIAPGRIDFGVGTGFTARRTMGLGAIPLKETRTYVTRVQQLLRGETIEWDFEQQHRKIGFLNPDLELINVQEEVPLWFSAFGPKSKALTAELNAGWLNFGAQGGEAALAEMQAAWQASGRDAASLEANLFFLGAVLDGSDADEDKLMRQGGPLTAVMFHNFADDVGAMGGANLPTGPLSNLVAEYLQTHERYEPADALRIAQRSEPLVIRSAASSMGPGSFKHLDHGFASAETQPTQFFIKRPPGGETEELIAKQLNQRHVIFSNNIAKQ